MNALLIGPDEQKKIQTVIRYAEKHLISIEVMRQIASGQTAAPGDAQGYRCFIPQGFRVVYTIEEQPIGWCRHISISINKAGHYPNPAAVLMLSSEFGFLIHQQDENLQIPQGQIWTEKEAEAVNVLQLLDASKITH